MQGQAEAWRRPLHDVRLLIVVRLEVCLFVPQGVEVRIAAGLIAAFSHGHLRPPEAADHRSAAPAMAWTGRRSPPTPRVAPDSESSRALPRWRETPNPPAG